MSRLKKDLIYPIFLECQPYCKDSFWENLFYDLAYGRTPAGVYISKDFLCCSYRGKEFTYKIERKNAELVYEEVYTLLTEKLGILSQQEKQVKRVIFQELEKSIKENRQEWSNIKKKNIKDTMYEKYVIEMQEKYNLTDKQAKYLSALIYLAMTFKTITIKDIVYDGDKISRIEGIDFEDGKIIMNRPLCGKERIEKAECREEKKSMSSNWEKFIKNIQKKNSSVDTESSIERSESHPEE